MIRQLKISLLNKIIFFSIIFFPQELLAKPCGNPNNLIKGENTKFIATYDLKKNKVIFGTNTNKFHKIADDMYGFEIYACTSGIFKIKKDDRKETSLFYIKNGGVETSSYSFNRVLKNRDDKLTTIFNVTDPSGEKLLPDGK